jgi:hypothetical protein
MSEKDPLSLDFDEALAGISRSMAGGLITLTADALDRVRPRLTAEDPLSAERFVHLADKLSEMAVRLYALGEMCSSKLQR